jgi:hypothetical protein
MQPAISIGFVYCEKAELAKAQEVVSELNQQTKNEHQYSSTKPRRLKLELKSVKLNENDNMISASLLVCNKLMGNDSVYAVIVGRTSCLHKSDVAEHIETLSAIFFTCAYYRIPVIDLYSREAEFSDNVN